MKESYYIENSSGSRMFCVEWKPKEKPIAVFQIATGMMEYIERYEEFADFLNKSGILVIGHDHRGHGKTASSIDDLGIVDKDDTFEKMLEDVLKVTEFAKRKYTTLPIILFGHSFGSFLSQAFISKYSDKINGVILSGTTGKMGIKSILGLVVSRLFLLFLGYKHKSKLLNLLVFGPYNKYFKPNKTKADWLSSVESEVQKYIEDEYCGGICSVGFFYQVFRCLNYIHRKVSMKKIRKDLPILIVEGSKDPVGDFLKNIGWLTSEYVKIGINSVSLKSYENFRHECLHEKDKEKVMKDILNWLNYEIIFKGKDKSIS